MPAIETMFVNRDGAKVWINKADLNPDIEREWTDKDEEALQDNAPKESMITVIRDGKEIEIKEEDYNEATDELVEEPIERPTDDEAVILAIVDVIKTLDKENADHFTNAGLPRDTVIEERLSYKVSKAEREQAMEAFNKS